MPNDIEAELKRVKVRSKPKRPPLRRDPALTGGERAETAAEKANRRKRRSRRPEPPIIQRPPG